MDFKNTSSRVPATHVEKAVYLNVAQVAARYGVSSDTIYRWRRTGNFPKPLRVGPGSTRWRLTDLETHDSRLTTGCLMVSAFAPTITLSIPALEPQDPV